MTNYHQYQQYQQQQVFTAPADKLLLMLFDGAIRFCKQANEAIEGERLEEAYQALIRAQEIVLELMNSLERNFEFTEQLYALYDYLYRSLITVNMKKDLVLLNEILVMLIELRQTWAEAAAQVRGTKKLAVGGGGLEG